jgi:hypothetical protein
LIVLKERRCADTSYATAGFFKHAAVRALS